MCNDDIFESTMNNERTAIISVPLSSFEDKKNVCLQMDKKAAILFLT